ncbi:hypothetical protein MTR67_023707 [Solanum verrucosum]|uniref:Uncharacterized protein n=1 Tax=Solanum verrucosum TaxID=315347 RepID=A0AAF0TRN0_SOLVR|nr:hypothetical protein MTR67_023707 [Solanum verrucosum]
MGSLACLGFSKRPLAKEIRTLESKFMQLGISEKEDVDRIPQFAVFHSSRCDQDVPRFEVKHEHQRPAGLLQRMPIPEWKWERIAMDFMVGLTKTLGKFDSIWVVVDRLTESAHFIRVRIDYNAQ